MSTYALVENGSVVKTMGLPKNYGNISGFNKMSNEKLKLHGFYPFSFTYPEFDALTHKMGDVVYTIGEDSVSGTREVVALDSGELAAIKAGLVSSVQDGLVQMSYDTDWIYLADAGLSGPQETAYANLRADMSTVKENTSSYSAADLESLRAVVEDAKSCMCSRFKDFSVKMTALQAELTSILGG